MQGLIFARACKHGSVVRSSARGTGFAVARLQDSSGHVFWSAPSFVQVVGNGVGIALGALLPAGSLLRRTSPTPRFSQCLNIPAG